MDGAHAWRRRGGRGGEDMVSPGRFHPTAVACLPRVGAPLSTLLRCAVCSCTRRLEGCSCPTAHPYCRGTFAVDGGQEGVGQLAQAAPGHGLACRAKPAFEVGEGRGGGRAGTPGQRTQSSERALGSRDAITRAAASPARPLPTRMPSRNSLWERTWVRGRVGTSRTNIFDVTSIPRKTVFNRI